MRSDEEITRLALEMEKLKGKAEWEYAESVLQLAIKANQKNNLDQKTAEKYLA